MIKEKLLASYDSNYPIKLLQDLIAIPSETPNGNVVEIIKRLDKEMQSLGFATRIVANKPDKPNLIAELVKNPDGPTVVLYAHADCAGIEGDRHLWKRDPYGGEIHDGNIYGNGAADAKSGIAQLIGACKTILDSQVPLNGNILFIATADGEIGDIEGAKWMFENNLIPNADFGINADASNLRIQYVYRGRAFFEFIVEGKVCHSNSPQNGINAISKMNKVITAIENYQVKHTPHPTVPSPTKTFTKIDGGVKHNSLPGLCRAIIDVRLVPGQTIGGVQQEFEEVLNVLRADDPDLHVKVKLMEFGAREVIAFPDNCKVLVEANKAFEEITGKKPDNSSGPGSAGCIMYFGLLGIPSIFFGPANLETAHMPDEHCNIDNLHIATKVTALTVANIVAG